MRLPPALLRALGWRRARRRGKSQDVEEKRAKLRGLVRNLFIRVEDEELVVRARGLLEPEMEDEWGRERVRVRGVELYIR